MACFNSVNLMVNVQSSVYTNLPTTSEETTCVDAKVTKIAQAAFLDSRRESKRTLSDNSYSFSDESTGYSPLESLKIDSPSIEYNPLPTMTDEYGPMPCASAEYVLLPTAMEGYSPMPTMAGEYGPMPCASAEYVPLPTAMEGCSPMPTMAGEYGPMPAKSARESEGRVLKDWSSKESPSLHVSNATVNPSSNPSRAKLKLLKAAEKAKIIGKGLEDLSRKGIKGRTLHEYAWREAFMPHHPFSDSINRYFRNWEEDKTTTLSFEDWLSEKFPTAEIHKVAYLQESERAPYAVTLRDGKLMKNDSVYHTGTERSDKGSGKAIFVMGSDSKLYAASLTVGRFHHSSFLAGQAVIGAGEIRTDAEGKLLEITNLSGHYKPTRENLLNVIKELQRQGVDLAFVKVLEQSPTGCKSFSSALVYLETRGECPCDVV